MQNCGGWKFGMSEVGGNRGEHGGDICYVRGPREQGRWGGIWCVRGSGKRGEGVGDIWC